MLDLRLIFDDFESIKYDFRLFDFAFNFVLSISRLLGVTSSPGDGVSLRENESEKLKGCRPRAPTGV